MRSASCSRRPPRSPSSTIPAGKTPEAYAVKGMPSSYLIDGTGKVVAVESGFRDEQKAELEARIRSLLALH